MSALFTSVQFPHEWVLASQASMSHLAVRACFHWDPGSRAPPREEAAPAIDNWLGDGYALFMEELTRPLEHLRAYLEGMVKAIVLLGCPHDRLFAAAEQDRVTADREAGHGLVAEAALVLEPEHVPIELL